MERGLLSLRRCLRCSRRDRYLGVQRLWACDVRLRGVRHRGPFHGRLALCPCGIFRVLRGRDFSDGKEPDDFFLLELRALAGRLIGACIPADKDAPAPIAALRLCGEGLAAFFFQGLDLLSGLFCAGVGSHVKAVHRTGLPGGGCGCGKDKNQNDGQTGDAVFSHGQSRCAE